MSIESVLASYGYPVLYLGAIFEGESFLVIAAVLCQTGHFDILHVIVTAFLGAISGDLGFFLAGRYGGAKLLKKRTHWQQRAARATRLLERHQHHVVFSYRFLYGLRAIIPFLIGMTGCSIGRFMLLGGAAAMVWSIAVTMTGLIFGKVLLVFISDLQRYQLWFLGGIAVAGLVFWAIRRIYKPYTVAD